MKIVYLPSWYPTPDHSLKGVFIKEQVEALCEHLEQADVVYLESSRNIIKSKFNKNVHQCPQFFHYEKFHWPKMTSRLFLRWCKSYKTIFKAYLEQTTKPDIIHSHGYIASIAAYEISKEFDLPFITTIHDTSLFRSDLPKWRIKLLKQTFSNSSKNIVVSTFLKHKMIELFPNLEFQVIPNMVSDDFLSEAIVKRSEPFIYGVLGALDSRKRVRDIVEAFSIVQENQAQVELWIIGSGDEFDKINKLIQTKSLKEKVKLYGWVDRSKLVDLVKNVNCMVSASALETFGISMIEALSLGIPVVASDSGGSRDIVNKKLGILIKDYSIDSLSKAMESMITLKFDSSLLKAYVQEKFSAKTVTNEILGIYNEI